MERVLITGSHGFIGRHLSEQLLSTGAQVHGLPRELLYDPMVLRSFIENINPTEIYHLATYGNMHSQTNEDEIFRANVLGTRNLLRTTRDIPYKRLIYVSTSSVVLPYQTSYSRSKRIAEILCEGCDKPISIVRPYSVTGVGEQYEHLIPTLIDASFTGKTIPFVPEAVHDFIDVEDVATVMVNISTPGIYHLGSGIGYTNQEVLELVQAYTLRKIKIERVSSMREYDNTKWVSPENWSTKSLVQSIQEMGEVYGESRG